MNTSQDVQYIGTAMLTRPTTATGLGSLQRPLIELYASSFEPKTGNPRALPVRRLTITERGIIITAIGPSSSGEQDTFYSMPSVVFWEAVRFITVRVSDKKFRGAFEPIVDGDVAKDNLYTDLDKQCSHLATHVKQHPALIVLVLRRTTGVKALELQTFACSSPRQAAYMVEILSAAQHSFGAQQAYDSNLFSYNVYDRSDVGAPQMHTVSPTGGVRMVDDMRRAPATVSAGGIPAQMMLQPRSRNSVAAPMTANLAPMSQSYNNLSAPVSVAPVTQHHLLVQDDLMRRPVEAPKKAKESLGLTGGALQGYYDMPSAVPLPILGQPTGRPLQPSKPSSSKSPQQQQEASSRQVGRSKTFQESDNVSVLHRSLDFAGGGEILERNSPYVNFAEAQRTKPPSNSEYQMPSSAAFGGKRPARPQTVYDLASKQDNQNGMASPNNMPPGGAGSRLQLHEQQQQPPQAGRAQLLSKNAAVDGSGGDRKLAAVAENEGSGSFDFLFGFNESQKDVRPQASSAADYKPVAMVQPRKVAGVPVFPVNMSGAVGRQQQQPQKESESVYQSQAAPLKQSVEATRANGLRNDLRRTQSSALPNSNSPVAAAQPWERPSDQKSRKEQKSDGILSLRTIRGPVAGVASSNSDYGHTPLSLAGLNDANGNNSKTPNYNYPASGNALPNKSTTSDQMMGLRQSSSSRAANNFELLRAAGNTSNDENASRQWSQPSSRSETPSSAVTKAGAEEMSSKDKEIASAIGEMRIDYEPSMATLQNQGNNFEKYLGYLP